MPGAPSFRAFCERMGYRSLRRATAFLRETSAPSPSSAFSLPPSLQRSIPTFPTHPTHPVENPTPTIPSIHRIPDAPRTNATTFCAPHLHTPCASFGKPHPKPHTLSRSSNLRSLPAPTFGNRVPTSRPASMRFCFAYPLFHAQRCTTTFYYFSFTSFLRSILPPPKHPCQPPPRNTHQAPQYSQPRKCAETLATP
jgi:hypothetical protein